MLLWATVRMSRSAVRSSSASRTALRANAMCFIRLDADMTGRKDYTDAMSQSMVVTVEAVRGKDGSVSVNSAVYDPVYMIKNSPKEDSQAHLKYMAVPAANYVSAEECPDIFTDESEWNRCKSAFKAICAIADKSGGRLVLNQSDRNTADSDQPGGKI